MGTVKKCVTEVFSRVTGFFRPVQDWNPGKTEEKKDRKTYNIGKFETEEQEESRIRAKSDRERNS